MVEQTAKVEWQVDDAVKELDAEWRADLAVLAMTLYKLRTGEVTVAEVTQEMNVLQQQADDLELIATLAETGENGLINGKNESTRKGQREQLLKTMRQAGGKTHDLHHQIEAAEVRLHEFEMARRTNLDTVTLQKLKLEHIDSVLKAIAG